jgi:hypothetical protein
LPAKDFPNTTHVITILASFGIWLFVAAAILSILVAAKFIEIIYLIISSRGASIISMVSGVWGQDSSSMERFENEQNRKGFSVIGDLAGAFTLLTLCLIVGFGWLTFQQKLVKWVAYYEDYLPATSYPGLDGALHDPSARVVFHDNGVVSAAHIRGSEVMVDVVNINH